MPAASVGVSTSGPALTNGDDASHMNGGTDGLGTSGKVTSQTCLTLSLPAKEALLSALHGCYYLCFTVHIIEAHSLPAWPTFPDALAKGSMRKLHHCRSITCHSRRCWPRGRPTLGPTPP